MIESPGEILGITGVLNGVVYARTDDARLVAYRVDTDAWTALALPDLNLHTDAWYPMVTFGKELLFLTDPFNPDDHVELPFELTAWNPATNAARKLPPAPLPPFFDMHVLSSDDTVFVLGAEAVPNPGSEKPSLLIGAEYRDGEGCSDSRTRRSCRSAVNGWFSMVASSARMAPVTTAARSTTGAASSMSAACWTSRRAHGWRFPTGRRGSGASECRPWRWVSTACQTTAVFWTLGSGDGQL